MFIHIPKTGGSSILFTYTDVFDIPDPEVPTHRRIDDFGVCPMDYWKFCVVRNPWAMCASWHRWNIQHHDSAQTMEVAVEVVQTPEHFELDRMDSVLRFETLGRDVERLMLDFGVPTRNLRRLNVSHMGDYRQYYTDHLRRQVAERFAATIERFGYEF
jgi:hypothetical protein